jgi:hypothetical protein
MGKKKFTITQWFPMLESWEVSSLEIVGIFHEWLDEKDFDSLSLYENAVSLFDTLHQLKNGNQLSKEDVKQVRGVCNKIKEHIGYHVADPKVGNLNDADVRNWRYAIHQVQLKRFLKHIPYTVGFLPPKLGVQKRIELDMPIKEYPLNEALIDGILRVHVKKMMMEDKNVPAEFINEHAPFFAGDNYDKYKPLDDGPRKILEMIEFYITIQLKRMKGKSRTVADDYMFYQVSLIKNMFGEVICDSVS